MELPAFCVYQEFPPEERSELTFDRHYLMYAIKGSVRLEEDGRRWTLPPSFAAWIPADTPIMIDIAQPITCCSVLYSPDFVTKPPKATKVFTMTSLTRDMIFHCRRWGPETTKFDLYAESFFRSLELACTELADLPSDVWQPMGKSDRILRAIRYTEQNLAEEIVLSDVANATHTSERTLLRHYVEEVGMTWQQSLRRMRMIRSLELLSNTNDQVAQVALQAGYSSLSAFNKAFRTFAGYTPTEFRARILDR